METFADSYYLLAPFNPTDAGHDAAIKAAKEVSGRLLTTEFVLTEVADALSSPKNRDACFDFLNDLRHSKRVAVVPASHDLFELGWSLFGARSDKDWSLTDCTSFVVMQERGITDALTGEHHFVQAGFQALLK